MNFSNVKAVHIPEGYVQKITYMGNILWEKPSLICNPYFSLKNFELVTGLPFQIHVSGLSQSLFRSFSISLLEYDESTKTYTTVISSVKNVPINRVVDDVLIFTGNVLEDIDLPNINTRKCIISMKLEYIDLNGHEMIIPETVPYDYPTFGIE